MRMDSDAALRQGSVLADKRTKAPNGIAVLHGVLEAVRFSKNSVCDKVPQELEALPRLRHR